MSYNSQCIHFSMCKAWTHTNESDGLLFLESRRHIEPISTSILITKIHCTYCGNTGRAGKSVIKSLFIEVM
jgi:hypothetical protein